uniref:NADH dehydrogenase subunit 6 n=1 Tax=Micromus paganus TaxID=1504851 RepID=UPI001BF08C19|nr:NADH dehydrogenase subunit 6 [Micromus paganus]QTZ19031.1 NADH dehydrogenase subunit 6 [Micromus paganus]
MTQFLLLLSFILTLNFTSMAHPLSMGLMLLIQTFLISMICGSMTYTFWFSYILFLVMVGGMLVLFIYMTSLASNEMFKFKMNNLVMNFIIMTFLITIFLINDNFLLLTKNFESINFLMIQENENSLNLIKLYNNPSMNMTLMLINYLFLTLVIIVKITNINYGPLRQNK